MTVAELQTLLVLHDDGVLKKGAHSPGREFCALEFDSKVRGREWSDRPVTLPDLRPINDAFGYDDAARTRELLPVMAALWDWTEWSQQRRQKWAEIVAIKTVQQIVAEMPRIDAETKTKCQNVITLNEAKSAANAAYYAADAAYAATNAAYAAYYAANAAAYAAYAAAYYAANTAAYAAYAAYAARKDVLHTACTIWIQAAEQTVGL